MSRNGVPFSLDIPDKLVTRDSITQVEFDTMMQTGLAQAKKNDSVSVDDFLSLSRGDDANLENEYISEAYDDFKINGNFVANYFKMATESFRIEVECKVRHKILKKYY